MTKIFFLDDPLKPTIPESASLQQMLKEYYSVTLAENLDQLQEFLRDTRQAVVVFSVPLDKVNMHTARIRTLFPTVATLAVIDQSETDKVVNVQFDTDFIVMPATRFDVLNRANIAARITELQSCMTESAHLDEVTQLYNRRHFMNRLNEEISLAKRHLSPVSMVVVGVNFFQMYVDSYGYEYVNELLKVLAMMIKTHKRHEDLVARIGDDEIGVLLPRSTEKGARPLADRVIKAINSTPFDYQGNSEMLSAQAGVVSYPLPDEDEHADADALLRYARHALHNARCSADNDVQLFSEIKPSL